MGGYANELSAAIDFLLQNPDKAKRNFLISRGADPFQKEFAAELYDCTADELIGFAREADHKRRGMVGPLQKAVEAARSANTPAARYDALYPDFRYGYLVRSLEVAASYAMSDEYPGPTQRNVRLIEDKLRSAYGDSYPARLAKLLTFDIEHYDVVKKKEFVDAFGEVMGYGSQQDALSTLRLSLADEGRLDAFKRLSDKYCAGSARRTLVELLFQVKNVPAAYKKAVVSDAEKESIIALFSEEDRAAIRLSMQDFFKIVSFDNTDEPTARDAQYYSQTSNALKESINTLWQAAKTLRSDMAGSKDVLDLIQAGWKESAANSGNELLVKVGEAASTRPILRQYRDVCGIMERSARAQV